MPFVPSLLRLSGEFGGAKLWAGPSGECTIGTAHMTIVFTDLDGTLLDGKTYSWESARPALEQLRCRGIPACR